MAIPTYQQLMLPFLRQLGDGQTRQIANLVDVLATDFTLTEEERRQMLPSGKATTFRSRVGWAKTYLKMSGLVENDARGTYRITDRGRQTLGEPIAAIDNLYLRRYPEFVRWYDASRNPVDPQLSSAATGVNEKTPDEILDDSFRTIRANLVSEILDKVKSCSPNFFERLVVELLVNMGYGGTRQDAGQAIGRSGDEGIDGIIKEDRLGLDVIYLQAKRWENTVSRPEIQKFAGALQGKRAKKGVFITTSEFTREAREFAAGIDNKLILIDGEELAEYMIDFNVGVSIVNSYEIKRIDSDYFIEE